MKYRIYFPATRGMVAEPVTLEAYKAFTEHGCLNLVLEDGGLIAAYAPGTWHTVVDMGAFSQAHAAANPPTPEKPARENSGRRQQARQGQAA